MTDDLTFRAGLSDDDDAPLLARPDIENWTENLWWIAHDSKTGMGLMAHLSSARHDFDVVRQTVLVFFPDGRIAGDVSFGGTRRERMVRGASLTMECLQPFREWHVFHNGVAQLSTLSELWQNTPRPGSRVPLRFDVKAECIGPVWTADGGKASEQMHKQDWASSHYQQTIRLLGTIDVDGVHVEFDGTGVRDHSRGPRHMGQWHGHVLSSAPFPGGRSFGIMSVAGPDGTALFQSAYVVRDGIMERGLPRAVPPLSRDILQPESFTIEIEVGGRIESIAVKTQARTLLSMLVPYDVTLGLYRDQPGGIGLAEAMATFTWDGEVGYGIVERSALTDNLPAGA